jgi:hypothetical protein
VPAPALSGWQAGFSLQLADASTASRSRANHAASVTWGGHVDGNALTAEMQRRLRAWLATRTKLVAMSLGGHRRTITPSYQTRARELISGELWLSVNYRVCPRSRSERIKNEDLDRAVTRSATRDTESFS